MTDQTLPQSRSESLQRYAVATATPQDGRASYGTMVPSKHGDWVRLSDVEALLSETKDAALVDLLRRTRKRLNQCVTYDAEPIIGELDRAIAARNGGRL